ncbi:MAG: DUF2589 domain-containing protein [Euryarchaeota archaeon]|nr:DUF2589 domain-containing protein [Euryarchaeota archaeon]
MANIPAELRALPLDYIVGAPLVAAIKAQALAANTTVAFIKEVGLERTNGDYKAVYVDFKFDRVVEEEKTKSNGDKVKVVRVVPSKLTVPLLTIVPIPYIRISDMTIDFEYQIRDVEAKATSNEANIATKAEIGGWFWKVEVKGSYTYKSTTRRSTDRRSTLKVTVNAVQDEIPEGLARVLDMLGEAIKVVPTGESGSEVEVAPSASSSDGGGGGG